MRALKSPKKAPYSLGFFGHAVCCKCTRCTTERAHGRLLDWEANERPKLDSTKPILVRAYWRRGNVRPETLHAHQKWVRQWGK